MNAPPNTPVAVWGPVAKLFHWSTALLIIVNMALGWTAVTYAMSPTKLALFNWHKSLGLLILAWVVLRLAWRATHRSPALPADMPRPERWAAHVSHVGLYLLMIVIPLSGWVINSAADFPLNWFGLFQVPPITAPSETLQNAAETVHYVLFWTISALILLHVAAALHHHFRRKNDVLRRMLPFAGAGR